MAKKKEQPIPEMPGLDKLPKEAQVKLKAIKGKLDKFSKKVVAKFEEYIVGVALLPPPKKEGDKEPDKDKISVLVVVDDTDSKRMPKEELRNKLGTIIESMAHEIDKNMDPQTIILSDIWQSCYDAKYDYLQMIAMAAPVYDKGMLAAIKISQTHQSMVLKKFEKYIVSYVLAGSLTQGKATKDSDIDVWIVIDDTDVKKMTRAELKDKLRAIIIGMGIEAGEMTGIKNKLNIQVYILTDFWDSLKEANPVIFTLLRDGVPFFDRGMFMPWKQLLKMGKIKPSAEAIDMFMGSGEQVLSRVHQKVKEIGMEDIYYAILTPSQAALMLYGIPPPSPRETGLIMRDVFVKKEKLLEGKYIDILEKNVKIRKELEHGSKKELTGKEVDELLHNAEKFLKRIKLLFSQIEVMKEGDEMVNIYDTVVTVVRDVLRLEGVEKTPDSQIMGTFEDELITSGKVPAKFLRSLKAIFDAKKDWDAKKLSKPEISKMKNEASSLIKFLVEFIQRKRGRELDRAKIRVRHGQTYGEVLLFEKHAYIIHDIDSKEKEISKAKVNKDGTLGPIESTTLEDYEKAIAEVEIPNKVFIKEAVFEDLKRIFGRDMQVLLNY